MGLNLVRVEVTRDGETEQVDLDLNIERFTLKESVRLEEAMGADVASLFGGEEVVATPKVLQALIWSKLVSQFPDVGLNDFDLDLTDLADVFAADEVEPSPADIERALFTNDEPVVASAGKG